MLKSLTPMLAVRDLAATRAFYEGQLGFSCNGTFEHGGRTVWCHLERDGVRLMFNQPPEADFAKGDPGDKHFQIYYVHVDGLPALHRRWRAEGIPVSDLRVTVYGMKEFELRDPDGHWLWFGEATDEAPTVRE